MSFPNLMVSRDEVYIVFSIVKLIFNLLTAPSVSYGILISQLTYTYTAN